MPYVEIGQDLIDAIKGGANGTGESETEEIVKNINSFGELCALIAGYIMEFYKAITKWLGK